LRPVDMTDLFANRVPPAGEGFQAASVVGLIDRQRLIRRLLDGDAGKPLLAGARAVF